MHLLMDFFLLLACKSNNIQVIKLYGLRSLMWIKYLFGALEMIQEAPINLTFTRHCVF